MSKKILCVVFFFLCSVVVMGCNDVKNLSEEQNRLIAEYAAELLLKYDKNYTDRIADGDTATATEQDMQTDTQSTENVTEVTTQEVTTQDNSKGQNVDNVVDESDDDKIEVATQSEGNIAKIAGVDGLSIAYKDYLITDQYPAVDEDGEFIYLEASSGYQLFVVRFSVTNTTSDVLSISLLDKDISYRLVCNGNKAATPMLTILMDDLGTLETTVNPEEEQEAVLVFQISEDMEKKLETIDLKINYNNVDNVIEIQK